MKLLHRLKCRQNMGSLDRQVRFVGGSVLVYSGLFTQSLSDSAFINYASALFGLTNVIAAFAGVCPGYLITRFSTLSLSKNVALRSDNNVNSGKTQTLSSTHDGIPEPEKDTFGKDSLQRWLLISICLPVAIVLVVFAYLFLDLSNKYRTNTDIAAAQATADIALRIETMGDLNEEDLRTEGLIAIIFHDAYGNPVSSIAEKIPKDPELASRVFKELSQNSQLTTGHSDHEHSDIHRTTHSFPDNGLWVSVFHKSLVGPENSVYPLLSRLVFAAVLALWISGWAAYFIIKRYTKSVDRASQTIRHRSTHDALTGLLNRTGLEEKLAERTLSNSEQAAFALILIDLANFTISMTHWVTPWVINSCW